MEPQQTTTTTTTIAQTKPAIEFSIIPMQQSINHNHDPNNNNTASNLRQHLSKPLSVGDSFHAPPLATSAKSTTTTTSFMGHPAIIKPTCRRYLILILYGICSMEKSFQWINLSTITNKVAFYYGVHNFAVNWTSVLFMITFIPLVLPTGILIEQIGLRKAILIGQFGITLGAIIKCFACDEDKFWLVLLGQVVVSLSEQFIFCIPSKIAAVWFPDEQVSIATGCGIFGNQLGIAMGFIIPQALLRNCDDKPSIRAGLEELFYWTAGIALLTMFALLVFFKNEPKNAPGAARLRQLELKSIKKQQQQLLSSSLSCSSSSSPSSPSFWGKLALFWGEIRSLVSIVWKLIRNRNCSLLMIAYGINVGSGYTIQTLLNQLITSGNNQHEWTSPNLDLNRLVGQIGLVVIFFGMLGALFWGYLCDLTHRYKLITRALYIAFIFTLIGFDFTIKAQDLRLIYPMAACMGFAMIGYTTAGLDMLVEYTYPIPELISTSLMVIWPQIFGTLLTFASSHIVDQYGRGLAISFVAGSLTVGLVVSVYVREQLKRQQAIVEKRGELEIELTGSAAATRTMSTSA